MINKDEFMDMIEEWYDNGEHQKIVDAILALSDNELDDDILGKLAVAYNNTGEFKKAIAVLESQRSRLDGWYKWHYRMGYALMNAADDEECENDEVLRNNILDRARVCFARCMNMNPPEDYLEDCDMYIGIIEERLNDGEEDEEADEQAAEMYDEEEYNVVEEHIKEHFGEFPTVYHEIFSPDIHVDICCVPPTEERNYYTLITMGMGAHVMNVPEELREEGIGRAELLICLPPDWKLGETSDEWYWPIALIKNLSRLPINCDTWLGYAHSVDNSEPFAPNTKLCGSLIILPQDVDKQADVCELPSGEKVRFFEVLPLYREEMDYKIDYSAEDLLDRMKGISHVTDINRPNVCEDYVLNHKNDYSSSVIDSGDRHVQSIRVKKLPLDEINGYNHLSIFLRWSIERGLISPKFADNYSEVINGVLNGTQTDLREFIRDSLDGAIMTFFFSLEGFFFIRYYYGNADDESVFYPCDVDRYAENYFGTERYNSEEFQDEAYLFVPFDEDYYRGLSAVIERHYLNFRENDTYNKDFAENCMQPLLGCKCTSFYNTHTDEIKEAFRNAKIDGKARGYTPLLVIYDPEGYSGRGEGLAQMLEKREIYDSITIAEVPVNSPSKVFGWFKSWFGGKRLRDVGADCLELMRLYGDAPAVINCSDDEPAPILFLPEEIRCFSVMIADPALNESGDAEIRLNLDKGDTDNLLSSMVHFLGCPYTLLAPTKNEGDILRAYSEAKERGKTEGFIPILAAVDEMFFKNIVEGSRAADRNSEFGFDPQKVDDFRMLTLSRVSYDGREVLDSYLTIYKFQLEDRYMEFEDILGKYTPNKPLTRFLSYWNIKEKKTKPLILAEIPVDEPWKVFAYFPWGNHYGVSRTNEVMAAAKLWYEKYGAVPTVIGRQELEFSVSRPVKKDEAMQLAQEMFAFCPDLEQNSRIGELAGSLVGSTVWYFRWDDYGYLKSDF